MGTTSAAPSELPRKHLSYYLPLQRTGRMRRKKGHWAYAWLKHVTVGFFLFDYIGVKRLVTWIATYHYVPLLASILAIWLNCTLHLYFYFVFPALREKYHWTMYAWLDKKDIPLAHDAMRAFYFVLAHMGTLCGIALLGYKLMNIATDAMFDSCLVMYDEVARCSVGFHGLLENYQELFFFPYARLVVFLLASCISVLLVAVLQSDSLVQWEQRDYSAFSLRVTVAFLLALVLVFDYRRNVRNPLGPSMIRWWRDAVPLTRRLYLYVLVIHAVYLSWVMDIKGGLVSFSGGMMYASIFHVVMLLAIRVTLFLYKLGASIVALAKNSKGRWSISCYMLLVLALVLAFATFSPITLVCLQVFLICTVVKTIVGGFFRRRNRLVETPNSTNTRGSGNGDLPIGEGGAHRADALNCMKRYRRPGFLLRALHRLILSCGVLLTLSLALWVSVKHPGPEGITPTRCEGDGTGEHIRVTARYMVADLYGLRDYEDPRKLVYEQDETKYNRARHEGLCSRRWGVDLHAADLAYFSLMTYLQRDSPDFSTMIHFYRRHRADASDWVAVPTNHTYGRAVFCHIYSPSKNTSVIAVRGTDITSPFDLLQNMLLFSETFIFKMLANILPFASLIPESVIVDYVAASSAISALSLGGIPNDYYHLHVEEYLRNVTSKHIILTGHSLGGVVAQIVAARTHLPAVVFSSPGINLMRKKLDIDSDAIDAFTTNVIVSNDFTVSIDTPGGTVYHIQCEHKTAEVCHSIELHTIRMWTVCPSYRAKTLLNGTYRLTG